MKQLKIKCIFVPAVMRDTLPTLSELLKKKIISKYLLINNKKLKIDKYPFLDLNKWELENKEEVSKLKGVIGLQLSYLKIFEDFIKCDDSHCFIFEDDILLPDDPKIINKRLKSIFTKELKEWDYLNLGRCYDKCNINTKYSENLVEDTYGICTHACGYSRRVALELLGGVLPIKYPCDWINTYFFQMNPKFKCYSAAPLVYKQNKEFQSLITNSVNKEFPECEW
jgi:GR25 family glycosyltransferase involved in LPS biosynthesis